jgi:hypothetical protein
VAGTRLYGPRSRPLAGRREREESLILSVLAKLCTTMPYPYGITIYTYKVRYNLRKDIVKVDVKCFNKGKLVNRRVYTTTITNVIDIEKLQM